MDVEQHPQHARPTDQIRPDPQENLPGNTGAKQHRMEAPTSQQTEPQMGRGSINDGQEK